MIVYKITNKINGKVYIGQTKFAIEKRFAEHCNWKCKSLIHKAIQKHGKENFSLELLATCTDRDQLNDAEIYFVDYFQSLSPSGYNLETGGNAQKEVSKETKIKQSIAHIGQPGYWTGKKLCKSHKEKLVAERTGKKRKPHSEEHKAKLSAAHKGKKMSEEACIRMSKAHKGRAPWNKGRKGNKLSEEHKAKISAGVKATADLQNSLKN